MKKVVSFKSGISFDLFQFTFVSLFDQYTSNIMTTAIVCTMRGVIAVLFMLALQGLF